MLLKKQYRNKSIVPYTQPKSEIEVDPILTNNQKMDEAGARSPITSVKMQITSRRSSAPKEKFILKTKNSHRASKAYATIACIMKRPDLNCAIQGQPKNITDRFKSPSRKLSDKTHLRLDSGETVEKGHEDFNEYSKFGPSDNRKSESDIKLSQISKQGVSRQQVVGKRNKVMSDLSHMRSPDSDNYRAQR